MVTLKVQAVIIMQKVLLETLVSLSADFSYEMGTRNHFYAEFQYILTKLRFRDTFYIWMLKLEENNLTKELMDDSI